MNYIKKFIVLLVTSSIILSNTVPVNASTDINTVNDFFTYWVELLDESVNGDRYEEWLKKVSKHAFDTAGFLIDESGIIIQKIKDAIHGSDNNIPSDMTDQDAYEWIKDNVSVSGNNIVYGDQFNNFVKNYEIAYVNDYPCYCYSYSITQMRNAFRNVAQLSGAESLLATDIVNGSPVEVWNFVKGSNSSGADDWLQCLEVSNYKYLIWRDDGSATNTSVIRCVTPYDGEIGTVINQVSKAYRWSTSSNTWELQSATNLNPSSYRYMQINPDDGLPSNNYYWNNIWLNSKVCQYRYLPHNTSITVDKVLTQPYYYNNDVWQDFSSTTGDYTFSPSNINTVTYGDTISYIDSFNNTEGYPPSPEQINIHIENENNNNTGGGGSGGDGGDDSGGGSGSGSGTDGIFDFLSDLGEVLGNLIKNLGQAITNIIKGISDLVTSIVSDLPTVFFDFIGAIFGWLPEEWVTLLSLSLAAMLIWGIVKVIRG